MARKSRAANSDEDAGHGNEIHRDFFFLLSWRLGASFDNYLINDFYDFLSSQKDICTIVLVDRIGSTSTRLLLCARRSAD